MAHADQVPIKGVGSVLSRKDKKDTQKPVQTLGVFSQSEVSFLAHSFFFLHSTPPCNVTYSSKPLYIQTPPPLCWSPKYTSSSSASSLSSSLRFFFNTTNTDHWADSANLEIQ